MWKSSVMKEERNLPRPDPGLNPKPLTIKNLENPKPLKP
jgi:hypothetical protein